MVNWIEIEKDGNPEKEGIYLCNRKNINYPFSLIIEYYTGRHWACDLVNASVVFPITHWKDVPRSPNVD